MKLNRKWIMVLALVMSMAMATTGTLAYLTDRDSEANVFTMGNVEIDLNEEFDQGAELIPGVEIEKKPTITNTGKNDAWVWATVAVPASLEKGVKITWAEAGWTEHGDATTVEQGGKNYTLFTYLYDKALAPNETTETPVMSSIKMLDTVDIDPDGKLNIVENGVVTPVEWNINEDGNPTVYVSAYAIQTEGFDSVEKGYEAYNAQWGENGTEFGTPAISVSSAEELEAALTADEETIVVSLEADLTYDVAAWENDAMGGDSTKSVTIIGNGNTITFNQTNSDWNNITTKNGSKLTITDAHITNSGHNDGPWNRHDLNFACEVELKNVTTDKAMAFKAGAKLTNVTISDANTSDTYAIWIQPNGQTVTLNNCTIDMLECTDGRGIKIDEQYVSTPGKVTLNVSNTAFATEEKAAILVKSAAGAQINLTNVNIEKVAADSTNPVWVDEASAAYADLVEVTGGTKVLE